MSISSTFLKFTSEHICVQDVWYRSIHTDIRKCLYTDVTASSIGGSNLCCHGPSGSSEKVIWADTSAIIESNSILYTDIEKKLFQSHHM